MFLALQSAFIGMALTLLGLVIERLLERSRSPSSPVRDSGLIAAQQAVDSSLNRSPSVGSDDSTAIRVRAPSTSTLDFVPAPISVPQIKDEAAKLDAWNAPDRPVRPVELSPVECFQIRNPHVSFLLRFDSQVFPTGRIGCAEPTRGGRARVWAGLVLTSLMLILLTGASDPAIIGDPSVPPRRSRSIFPPAPTQSHVRPTGSTLWSSAAIKGTAGKRITRSPRLIRAHHHARWNAGVLSGRTELVIEAAGSGPSDFLLEPWTPAILPRPKPPRSSVLAIPDARACGSTSRRSRPIALDWELKPRSHPHGRSFTLALPGDETTVLALEVPKDWIPSSRQGRRRGPRPAADPSRNLWEIEAESGRIDLHLYDPDEQGESYVGTNPWLSSTTQIDLRGTSDRAGGLANWTTDWRVELDPRNLKHAGDRARSGAGADRRARPRGPRVSHRAVGIGHSP